MTVAYPKQIVHGEADIGRGLAPEEVHFCVHNYLVSELPEAPDKLEAWCCDIWRDKEQRLERFYKEKTFAVNGEGSAVLEEKERSVQQLFWCVVVFWAVFLAGVMYAFLFWPLFKWYCLLSIVTFVFLGHSYGGVDSLLYAACA